MPILKKDEQQLLQESADLGTLGKGTLILTSQRLLFESQTGFISKKTETALDLPLRAISDVKVEGLISKKLIVHADISEVKTGHAEKLRAMGNGNNLVGIQVGVKNPQGWESQIRAAVQSA